MFAKEGIPVKGTLEVLLKRADGTIEKFKKDNLICNVGFDFIADAIGNGGARPAVMGYIAVGTSATAAAAGDTTLGAESARVAATYSHTAGTKTFQLAATFNPGVASAALTEAGVLNGATGGILFDHVVFPVINKGANDTLTATFTFTMS